MKKKKLENLKLGGTEYSADGLYLQTDTLKQLDRHIPSEEELYKNEDKNDPTSFLYDKNSGNVHLFPENAEDAKKYAECIQEKQTEVRKYLKEKLEKNSSYSKPVEICHLSKTLIIKRQKTYLLIFTFSMMSGIMTSCLFASTRTKIIKKLVAY